MLLVRAHTQRAILRNSFMVLAAHLCCRHVVDKNVLPNIVSHRVISAWWSEGHRVGEVTGWL